MENKNNKRRSLKYLLLHLYQYRLQNRQKGSLLIGLIVTMVIFSILGGAMVYIFSSSSMDAVFGNSAQRAYYAAESGARYRIAQYRHSALSTDDLKKDWFLGLSSTTPITLPSNNGDAIVTITDSMNGVTADQTTKAAEAKTLTVGCNLLLTAGTSTPAVNFPLRNGFFKIINSGVAYPTVGYYRYKYRTMVGPVNTLYLISGTGTLPAVTTASDIIAPPDQVSITSKGYSSTAVGLSLSRAVEFGWILGGGGVVSVPLGANEDEPVYALSPTRQADWSTAGGHASVESGSYPRPSGSGSWHSTDIIASDYYHQGSGSSTVRYLFIPFKHTTGHVDFAGAKSANSGYLSYEVQTKVSMGPELTYGSAGIAFRVQRITPASNGDHNGYVVSFMRVRSGSTNDYIPSGVKPRDASNTIVNNRHLLVLWEQTSGSTSGRWLAYKVLNDGDSATNDGDFDNYVRGQQYIGDGNFFHDESSMVVRVVEKAATTGTTNDIQVFFGDAWHSNSTYNRLQNTNPYDVERLRYVYEPALGDGNNDFPVKWPSLPGLLDWTATANDFFTAVVWDRINPNITTMSWVTDDRGNKTIVRDNIHTTVDASYNSQDIRPEIAMHAFGTLDSNVYFLDFAFRFLTGGGSGGSTYIGPIQQ